ncbi:hypothetical protein [Streptodolium elevatio]
MFGGYQALVVGIEGPPIDLARPKLGARPPLEFAAEYAERVRTMLTGKYGYVEVAPQADPAATASALEDAVDQVLTKSSGFAVVHLLSHGLSGAGEKLYVVGGDGRRTRIDVESWLATLETGDDGDAAHEAPNVLFLLDLCYAGAPARLAWQQFLTAGRRRGWVIAAAQPGEEAYDGILSQAVAEVLAGFHDGTIGLHQTYEFIPFERFCHEVAVAVARRAAQLLVPQEITLPMTQVGTDLSWLRFFRNPRFDRSAGGVRRNVDIGAGALLDEALDQRHFVGRAGGVELFRHDDGDRRGMFQGREEQVVALTEWFAGFGPPFRVVTGKPGGGKSALLGVLVCAAHPRLRAETMSLWEPSLGWDTAPEETGNLAVVHARRRSYQDILASLARQWGLAAPPDDGSGWTVPQVVDALAGWERPAVLVLDALDEAERPEEVVSALLTPLLAAVGGDGQAAFRILVGARPEERFAPLFARSAAMGGLLDLSTVPDDDLIRDLTAYVRGLLRDDPGFAARCPLPVLNHLAKCIAGEVVRTGEPQSGRSPREAGEFLVSALFVRYVLGGSERLETRSDAEQLAALVPKSLGMVLRLDLLRRADFWVAAVLAVLAYSQGAGMPERVIAAVAPAFAPGHLPTPGIEEIRRALESGRFYLRRDADREGSPLYRLFHQGLADELRANPFIATGVAEGTVSAPGGFAAARYAREVWAAMLASVPRRPDGVPRWDLAEPYLVRHAAQHALDAGELDELLDDAEFLVHADPDALAAVLQHLPGQLPLAASVYLAGHTSHRSLPATERRQMLAVDAMRFDATELAERLLHGQNWSIRWTAGSAPSRALRASLPGHPQTRIWTLRTVELDGRTLLLSGADDNTLKIWDLDAHAAVQALPHPTPVGCVVPIRQQGELRLVTGCDDGWLWVWSWPSGELVDTFPAHETPVWSLAATPDGRLVASGAEQGSLRTWNLATGDMTGDFHVGEAPVNSLDVCLVDGAPHLLGTCGGAAAVWRVTDGVCVRDLDASWATVARTVLLNGTSCAVVGSSTGKCRVWDLGDGSPVVTFRTHDGAVVDLVAVAAPDDARPHIATVGSDGVLGIWEVASGGQVAVHRGHTTQITAVCGYRSHDGHRLVTGGERGSIRIWETYGPAAAPSAAAHRDPVIGVLAAHDASGDTAVSLGWDSLRLWNLRDGTNERLDHGENHFHTIGTTTDGRSDSVFAVGQATLQAFDASAGGGVTAVHFWSGAPAVGAAASARIGDHEYVVLGDDSGALRWLPLRGGSPQEPAVSVSDQRITLLASLPRAGGGPLIAALDLNGRLVVVDGDHPPQIVEQFDEPLHAMAFTMLDGDAVLLLGGNGHVHKLNLRTGHANALGCRTDREVTCVVPCLRDGRPHALTGGTDRKVRLWDLALDTLVDTFAFPDSVFALAVTNSGDLLVGMGADLMLLSPDPAVLRLERASHA